MPYHIKILVRRLWLFSFSIQVYRITLSGVLYTMREDTDVLEAEQGGPVWHPLVHRRFSEELHYFLISTSMYSSEFKVKLCRFLSDIGATGFCMYEIFGNYDILLHVWLTNTNRSSFIKYAEESQDILGIEEFMVQGFNMSWRENTVSADAPSEEDLKKLSPDVIQKVQFGQLPPEEIDELLSKKILLSRNISFSKEEYKFFVLVNYPGDIPIRDFEVVENLKGFISGQDNLQKILAYSGIGFTRYLIKAVTGDFYNILDFVLALISEFRLLNVQTNTIVVAEKQPYESDNIAFPGSMFAEQRLTLKNMLPQLYEANISLLELNLLESKVFERLDAFRNDDGEVLHIALNHIIAKDAEGLAAHLMTYLGEFESFLRESFPRYTVGLHKNVAPEGTPSPDKLMSEARQSSNISKNKKGSFGDWVGRYECVLSAIVDSEDNWAKKHNRILNDAASWRNKFANADYGDLIQAWDEIIDFLSDFVSVKEWIEKHISEKKEG